jgi:hypothetical protein
MLPDFDRADWIGEFWGYPETREFGELLIDLEEDRVARAVVPRSAEGDGAEVAPTVPASAYGEMSTNRCALSDCCVAD